MPLVAEEITLKRLSLAKLLYQQAAVQVSATHGDVSNILAVVIFDLAAETALKAVVSALDPSRPPADKFQAVIDQADQLLGKRNLNPVPDKTNLQHVHALRNDAQHKAKYPDNSQVQDCRTYTRDFLNKLLMDVWGLSLETMSLTDLVKHQGVKEYLVEAEAALQACEFNDALIKAHQGFDIAMNLVKEAVVGRMNPDANPNLTYVSWDRSEPSTAAVLEVLRDHIVRTTVGLNFSDYLRYRRIINSVIQGMAHFGGGKFSVAVTGKKIDQNEAEFVVSYAVNAVIQLEGVAGSLDSPFQLIPNPQLGKRLQFT